LYGYEPEEQYRFQYIVDNCCMSYNHLFMPSDYLIDFDFIN
jgi:hypothetical protein